MNPEISVAQHNRNSNSTAVHIQWTAFHVVILGPRSLPCCGSKVTAEGKRDRGVFVRRCLWAKPGGDIHHVCPHPTGQNQAVAFPRCKEGGETKSLAWQPLCCDHSSLGRGQDSLVNTGHSCQRCSGASGALSLPGIRSLLVEVCLPSLWSPFPGSLGSRWLVLTCTKTEHIRDHPEPLSPPLTKQRPSSLLSEASALNKPTFPGGSE